GRASPPWARTSRRPENNGRRNPQHALIHLSLESKYGLLDNSVSNYRILRGLKNGIGIINWFLNVQMVQAWRLYRRVGKLKNVRKGKQAKEILFSLLKIDVGLHPQYLTDYHTKK
ncbi:PiggyBac transposable elementderived protein 3like, partial [Caligus rogercresseyi]